MKLYNQRQIHCDHKWQLEAVEDLVGEPRTNVQKVCTKVEKLVFRVTLREKKI